MKLFKRILICFFALLSIITIVVFIKFWPVDSRFQGEYISDRSATVDNFKSSGKFTQKQIDYFNNVFGNSKIVIDGHKYRFTYQDKDSDGPIVHDYFWFVISSNKSAIDIAVFPKTFSLSKLNEEGDLAKIIFTPDGFWLECDTLFWFSDVQYKEKFKKIKS